MAFSSQNSSTHSKVEISDKQKSFKEFTDDFKSKLKNIFHVQRDIDQLSIQRGLPPHILQEIMLCNPLSGCIPSQYGGRGGQVYENLALISAASYESLSLSLTFGINYALFLQPITKYANEEVKGPIFKRFLQNQNMGGLMITEPDYGSDALRMQTSYIQESNGYHIQGTKHWAGLTGLANYWLLTARKLSPDGNLMRDIDFFICDANDPGQKIIVEEYFENLGLYMIPYGRNRIDVHVPAIQRLEPQHSGVQMLLDILHRSRIQFPGMGLGFIQRMLDEAISHCQSRQVGGRSLLSYDQVQQRLARLQADFTICSAMCAHGSERANIKNNLAPYGLEANSIKTYTTDLMQEAAQSLQQLVGAKGYKLNHIAGRGIVDSRPFQIFEGSNDILYAQISEMLLKLMRDAKEKNIIQFLSNYSLTTLAANYFKKHLNFEIDTQLPQRKMVELGRVVSRIIAMQLVVKMGDKGFRKDLISGALTMLEQEITNLLSTFTFVNKIQVVEDYGMNSYWVNYVNK